MSNSPWQESQMINSELGPRNENQQLATQQLTEYVNHVRGEAIRHGRPQDGERDVQMLYHELAEKGIGVQPQPGYAVDQFNRQIPVTNYVPFRAQPQYAQPYYDQPPAAVPAPGYMPPPGAIMPPPAVYMAPPECRGVNLGVGIPLGNGAVLGLNLPLVERCRRDFADWQRHHPEPPHRR